MLLGRSVGGSAVTPAVMQRGGRPRLSAAWAVAQRLDAALAQQRSRPAAPALTNAIFNAAGIRIRKLPIAGQAKEK